MPNTDNHPCFSGECHPSTGRIHLPVSPVCNIRCRFCGRGINSDVAMPGNASRVLSPKEALDILQKALTLCPELRVAGVAGPGDPLASSHALDTLLLVKNHYPNLINCLSTNGLALASSLPRLIEAGVKTLTVTVNAVDPHILEFLVAGILYEGKFIKGQKAMEIFIAAQEQGILQAIKAGMTIKINMVLVPRINDGHVEDLAKKAAFWGASYLNIIPVMAAAEFIGHPVPTPEELAEANEIAGRYLPIMRHCRRCRADACGVPGAIDFAKELYGDYGSLETYSHG